MFLHLQGKGIVKLFCYIFYVLLYLNWDLQHDPFLRSGSLEAITSPLLVGQQESDQAVSLKKSALTH